MVRKNITSLLLLLMCNMMAWSRAEVRTFKLSNGMTVWINEDDTQPKVFGAVVVKAGAKDCPNTGIAHYLEHLLFKGTQSIGTVDYAAERPWLDSISAQYDLLAKTSDDARRLAIQRHINALSVKASAYAIPNEFSNLISLYGGTGLNAYTSFDETVFHNSFSPQYFRQWCELNSERLKDPVFRLFQGELETVYEEKNMYADNLIASTAEKVQQYALAGTPYAYPIIGATDSLKNPRLSEMMRFFHKEYVPENMGLILVGGIPLDSIDNILEETFGKLKGPESSLYIKSTESGKPISKTFHIRDFRNQPAFRFKVPIPIVKVGGYVWQAPDEHSKDYAAFKVMTAMLMNSSETGLIDSLSNCGKLMFAAGMGYDFKVFSAWGFGFVPRLPFGSRKKSEKMCFEQIDKLKQGDFSNADLEAEKLTLRRNNDISLETVSGRSKAMINAFSHGLAWGDVLGFGDRIASVTKADIMRVARKYLNDDSLKIVKKFGSYPKEHVSQPGYKPVRPVNAGKQSGYAKALAELPINNVAPKLIDFDKDANLTSLAPLVNLYTVRNPENNVFTLQVAYLHGKRNDRRIGALEDYLGNIGTEKHSKQQFGQLLRQQGATLGVDVSDYAVTLTLTGFDNHFNEAMALLHEFITEPKADERKFKDMVKAARLEEKTFFKDNQNIAAAVMQKVEKGVDSEYLNRLSVKELKRMNGKELISLFKQLQHWQTDIIYCGRLDAKEVENNVKSCLDLTQAEHSWEQVKQEFKPNDGNVVYIYDDPSARQTIVGTYQQTAPMPTVNDRARMSLWGNYFGGGMQSVTFQEIREFRSLAYSTHGTSLMPVRKLQPDAPCGYITMTGTQGDKTMQTAVLIDSLLKDMPLRENNIAAAKQSIINSINNGYPSFRSIANDIATLRLYGYEHDPNADLLTLLPGMGMKDVNDFYRQNIQGKPHATIIVGNKKYLDLGKLAKLGKIVILKAKDIYKR